MPSFEAFNIIQILMWITTNFEQQTLHSYLNHSVANYVQFSAHKSTQHTVGNCKKKGWSRQSLSYLVTSIILRTSILCNNVLSSLNVDFHLMTLLMFDNKYIFPLYMLFSRRQSSDFRTYFLGFTYECWKYRNSELISHIYSCIHSIRNVECWRLENIVVVGEALFR